MKNLNFRVENVSRVSEDSPRCFFRFWAYLTYYYYRGWLGGWGRGNIIKSYDANSRLHKNPDLDQIKPAIPKINSGYFLSKIGLSHF